jgi:hypothetical protein
MYFIQDDLNEDLWNDWLEFEIEQVIPLILEYTVACDMEESQKPPPQRL